MREGEEVGRGRLSSSLDGAAVDLWFALEPPDPDPQLATEYRRLMSDDERRRELDFVHEKDRGLYRLARALARTVLSRYAPVDPPAWEFVRTRFGKPVVASPAGAGLDFSLAHTPGIAVLLVAAGRSLGVDVENARRPVAIEPALPLLGPSEIADLRSTPAERQGSRFLEYWTLKESYSKARGTGLSLPLDRCEFRLGAGGVEATIDPELDEEPERWWFTLVSLTPGFVAAATVSRRDPHETPRLETRSTLPLRD